MYHGDSIVIYSYDVKNFIRTEGYNLHTRPPKRIRKVAPVVQCIFFLNL